MELNETMPKPVSAGQQAWDRYWEAEVLDSDFLIAKIDGDISAEEYEAGKSMFRAEVDRFY